MKKWLASMACVLVLAASAPARTITLTAEDCDQLACISGDAPRLSWAMLASGQGVFNAQPQFQWNGKHALLMRFPIADIVPKGQRITKAELTIAPNYLAGAAEVHVRRVLAEWGTGVCHEYRMVHPQKIEWAQPGGRGAATDRHNKDTAVFKVAKIGEHTADVTEDIELWYTGALANRGWIMTLGDGQIMYVVSPYTLAHIAGGKQWKLQITFEPR